MAGAEAARKNLAWESILTEKEALDLSPFQVKRAETQMAEVPPTTQSTAAGAAMTPGVSSSAETQATVPTPTPEREVRRFHGVVHLDPNRVGRDASPIADEVIAHLGGLLGAELTVTIEIEAKFEAGVPDQVVRPVTENSRTLKFRSHGFERE